MSVEICVINCLVPGDEQRAREIFAKEYKLPCDLVIQDDNIPTDDEKAESTRLLVDFLMRCIFKEHTSFTEMVIEIAHSRTLKQLVPGVEFEEKQVIRTTIRSTS